VTAVFMARILDFKNPSNLRFQRKKARIG